MRMAIIFAEDWRLAADQCQYEEIKQQVGESSSETRSVWGLCFVRLPKETLVTVCGLWTENCVRCRISETSLSISNVTFDLVYLIMDLQSRADLQVIRPLKQINKSTENYEYNLYYLFRRAADRLPQPVWQDSSDPFCQLSSTSTFGS